jgi:hypothetical protein
LVKRKARKSTKLSKSLRAVPQKAIIPERLKEYVESHDFRGVRKAPRLLALLFCDYVNSTNDGKVNLLGAFDRIMVHPEKRLSPPFIVFARAAEAIKSPLWLTILDPDNQPQAEVRFDPPQMPADRDPGLPNQIQFMLQMGMKFAKNGTYWFDVSYEGESLGGAGLVVGQTGAKEDAATDTFA